MTRFDLISGLMLQSKSGEWIRYEDTCRLVSDWGDLVNLKESRIHELEASITWAKQQTKDVTRNLRDTQDALEKTQIALNVSMKSLVELYYIVLTGKVADYDEMTAAIGRARKIIEGNHEPASRR